MLGIDRRRAARGRPRGRARACVHPDDRERVAARARRTPSSAACRSTSSAGSCRPDGDERAGPRASASSTATSDGAPDRAARQRCRTSPSSARPRRRWRWPPPNAEAAAREHAIADELQRSLLPPTALRPRAPRGRDLLPRRRRGHPGRRRLVRRHRARRRPHRARHRRRDGPRRARRGGDGPAARRGARLRPARPAARRPARVPRRRGPRARRGPDRHLRLRGLRPRRPARCVYANAGHLPPLRRGARAATLPAGSAATRPAARASGRSTLDASTRSSCPSGALLVLYTDGLVERRGEDLDAGHRRARRGTSRTADRAGRRRCPRRWSRALLPDGPDDDVAVLVARVDPPRPAQSLSRRRSRSPPRPRGRPRRGTLVAADLRRAGHAGQRWSQRRGRSLTSELVTNARPARPRRRSSCGCGSTARDAADRGRRPAPRYLPRKLRPTPTTSTAAACSSSPRSPTAGAPARSRTARPCGACSARGCAQPGDEARRRPRAARPRRSVERVVRALRADTPSRACAPARAGRGRAARARRRA